MEISDPFRGTEVGVMRSVRCGEKRARSKFLHSSELLTVDPHDVHPEKMLVGAKEGVNPQHNSPTGLPKPGDFKFSLFPFV